MLAATAHHLIINPPEVPISTRTHTQLTAPTMIRTLHAGRFGIGFNSVYHLTDLPAFVSAGKWCTFDPQAAFLPSVNPANPGKMVDFLKNPETVQRYPDQVRSLEGY